MANDQRKYCEAEAVKAARAAAAANAAKKAQEEALKEAVAFMEDAASRILTLV